MDQRERQEGKVVTVKDWALAVFDVLTDPVVTFIVGFSLGMWLTMDVVIDVLSQLDASLLNGSK